MALASYQKLTRVVSSAFGDGSDGAYSSATIPTMTYVSISGTSGGTSVTAGSTSLSNGDIVLMIQMRGTGVGQWEINKVSSGGGSTSITMQENLQFTYTDSGASQAQAVVIPQYTDVTVQSGTWTVSDWDGNVGGILAFASNGTTTVTGTINGDGKGFIGGASVGIDTHGKQGEGTSNAGGSQSTSANGSGGGGGQSGSTVGAGAGGGGGGNGTTGSSGTAGSASRTPGSGGSSVSGADLTTGLVLGGAGGSGGGDDNTVANTGSGGDSGAIVAIFVNDLTGTGTITLDGLNGGNGAGDGAGGGGGGSGGSFITQCATADLSSMTVGAVAGVGGSGGGTAGNGGNGGTGKIAIHHSGSVTGTTTPTFNDTTDSTLIAKTFTPRVIFM